LFKRITSDSNPKIKRIKELSRKKYRDKYGEYVIEGSKIIEHAVETGAKLTSIFITEDFYNHSGENSILRDVFEKMETYIVPEKLFKEISTTDTPQGILGIVKKEDFQLEDILIREDLLIVVLDRLQDPGNIGTIIRTADAAGADCVLVDKGCVDVYNPKTVRASMGSIFNIPVINVEDILKLLDLLIEKDVEIISTVLDTNTYYYDVDYGRRVAVLIGNEGSGLANELIEKSHWKVKIPILGKAESLNASIASSIVIYEIQRQRIFRKFKI